MIDYVSKERTRVEGPWEWGTKPKFAHADRPKLNARELHELPIEDAKE